jgi:hypothetical protein
MRSAPFLCLLLAALANSGCVTFKDEEFAVIRSCQVSPAVYRKLTERQVVTPDDVVELWRRRVPPALIEKQIDKIGVDYALRQSDVDLLTRNGVSAGVIAALRAASERYVSRYAPPEFFEKNDLNSGDYLVAPRVRTSGSLLYGPNVLQD